MRKREGAIRSRYDPNEFVVRGDFCEIVLYDRFQNEKARAIIDLGDIERCEPHKWCMSADGCAVTSVNKVTIFLHNFIMDRGADCAIQPDHRNRNRLDCQKGNLRLCTVVQNHMNRSVLKKALSKFKGVCWDSRAKKWKAALCVNKIPKNLGSFDTEIEAALVYDKVAAKYHKEFAVLNFPKDSVNTS